MRSASVLLTGFLLISIANSQAQTNQTLAEARARASTRLLIKGPAPQEYEAQQPPKDVREITYESHQLRLKAWITDIPDDGKKHPAVLFLHGGFAFDLSDWQMTSAFRKAGFVVMSPMLRGENGNPGSFEMFYGEVDDVIAALRHLRQLSKVDSTNIFIAGHSAGGTLAQLASMVTDQVRAVASFSGAPDQGAFCNNWKEIVPFDLKAAEEIRLRSPLSHPGSVRTKLLLYAGDEELDYVRENRALARRARALGKDVTFKSMPGDHFSALPAAMADAIKEFKSPVVETEKNPASK